MCLLMIYPKHYDYLFLNVLIFPCSATSTEFLHLFFWLPMIFVVSFSKIISLLLPVLFHMSVYCQNLSSVSHVCLLSKPHRHKLILTQLSTIKFFFSLFKGHFPLQAMDLILSLISGGHLPLAVAVILR